MILALGNRNAAVAAAGEDGSKSMRALEKGKRVTMVEFPDEWALAQCFRALTDGDGVINNHFSAGAKPAWVASDNEALASLVSDNYGGVEIRELELPDDAPTTSGSKK